MAPSSLLAELRDRYPALLADAPPGFDADLARLGPPMSVPAGATLFDEGHACQGFPLVLDGEVRVARGAADGRSLELYRVRPGEFCVVSTACALGQSPLSAQGSTAQPTRLLLVPTPVFLRWCEHGPWRQQVFALFAQRMTDLIGLAEAIAFQRLDQRLAAALLGHPQPVQRTHQQLAEELGTVREIVTRLLKRFEQAGWVELARERITLTDADALRRRAAGAD
jgi:CRP/FNR family transcriptional regulator